MKTQKNYSRYFKLFLRDFGLHGVEEYEKLTPKQKQITDRAYLRDIPVLIKKYWNKNQATE